MSAMDAMATRQAIETVTARWRAAGWQLLREEPMTPALNVALDDVLTRQVGAGERPPTLRFWAWASRAVIIGRFQSVRNEVNLDAAAEMGVTVVRRISGGGAMFVEPEKSITYSLYLPEAYVDGLSFTQSYEALDNGPSPACATSGWTPGTRPSTILPRRKARLAVRRRHAAPAQCCTTPHRL